LWALALGIVVVLGVLLVALSAGSSVLADADTTIDGQTVNGIECNTGEHNVFHTHSHLAVFVDGDERGIPSEIGAPPDAGCLYWLHSHTDDGIIHIEAPERRTFTLGDYFDIWQQPLSRTRVGPAQGEVIAYVDGERFEGNPREIELAEHTLVQLDVGEDVQPEPFEFPSGL
jgi:hypothetical protein